MSEAIQQAYERFAASLEESEGGSRDALLAHQRELVTRLTSFAFETSQFYRNRLAPLFRSSSLPDLRAWSEVAILTRAEVASQIEAINPVRVPPDVGPVSLRRTSGSTESQLTFRTCYIAQMVEGCMAHRLYRWHGFDVAAPMASIRYYGPDRRKFPEGQAESQWSYPGPNAKHHTLNLDCSTEDMIEWLLRKRPRYLTTLPSIAQEIALHPNADKLEDLELSAVCGVSELATRFARDAVKQRFGCDILEIYAAGEVGCIALRSPEDHALLACEENVLLELLDEAGLPVAPGDVGRVVVTGLYNYATPFIRYETGDYARLATEPCRSGRCLRRLERIEGRKRNALVDRSGRRVWLHDVLGGEAMLRVPASLFQIVQRDIETIEFNYIPLPGMGQPSEGELAAYFGAIVNGPVKVNIREVSAMPRPGGRKHEAVISDMP